MSRSPVRLPAVVQLFCLVDSFCLCFHGNFLGLILTFIAASSDVLFLVLAMELERLSLLERAVLHLVRLDALDLENFLDLADRQVQNVYRGTILSRIAASGVDKLILR